MSKITKTKIVKQEYTDSDEKHLLSINKMHKSQQASHDGKDVNLDQVFKTPNESKKYAVHTKNQKGDIVKVRFGDNAMSNSFSDEMKEKYSCSITKDKSDPSYWVCKMFSDSSNFEDKSFVAKAFFDFSSKKVRSVRDGVQEYLGIEIGMSPPEKIFRVYRSPETITSIVKQMKNLPIINDHIPPNQKPTASQTIGLVDSADIVELIDSTFNSTLVLENPVKVNEKVLQLVQNNKKELSLGYIASTRAHDVYDLEQYDMIPKHLAIVDNARGGSGLTFIDGNGKMIIGDILKMFSKAPKILKEMDAEELKKLTPAFKEIIEFMQEKVDNKTLEDNIDSNGENNVAEKTEEKVEKKPLTDEEKAEAEKKAKEEADKKKVPTKDEEADKKEKDKKEMMDSTEFKDAVAKIAIEKFKEHSKIVSKAKDFLPEEYEFTDKLPEEIMKDAVKTSTDKEYSSTELPIAFEMLQKNNSYKEFGDSKTETNKYFSELADKDL